MGRSLREVYIHFIWTTKEREPVLRGQLELFVHRRIREIADENHGITVLANNSAWDHTHTLAAWNTTGVIADVVREWKSRIANEWNDPDDESKPNLAWQIGAGIFSVSPHEVGQIVGYIGKQKQHHRDKTTIHRYERGFGRSMNFQSSGGTADA